MWISSSTSPPTNLIMSANAPHANAVPMVFCPKGVDSQRFLPHNNQVEAFPTQCNMLAHLFNDQALLAGWGLIRSKSANTTAAKVSVDSETKESQ